MDPVFLTLSDVIDIHTDQIRRHGGSPEIRDVGLLGSARGMPKAGFGGEYLHSDIFEMAAAYLYHIVSNHPFVDGNKRTGAVSAIVFLILNGYQLKCREEDLEQLVLGIAKGEHPKHTAADFLRRHGRES
jgi:death-on-curing protein